MQSSSGFGYAIICMAIWPMFMPFYTASILEAIAAFFMVIYIAVKLWKFIATCDHGYGNQPSGGEYADGSG